MTEKNEFESDAQMLEHLFLTYRGKLYVLAAYIKKMNDLNQ